MILIKKSFTVGGQYCRLEYLSGKCERNEREEWITQLGFHWEYWFEEEFHSCGMSSPSLASAGYPSRLGCLCYIDYVQKSMTEDFRVLSLWVVRTRKHAIGASHLTL